MPIVPDSKVSIALRPGNLDPLLRRLEHSLQLECGLLRIGKLRPFLIHSIPIGGVFDSEENVARFEMLAGWAATSTTRPPTVGTIGVVK